MATAVLRKSWVARCETVVTQELRLLQKGTAQREVCRAFQCRVIAIQIWLRRTFPQIQNPQDRTRGKEDKILRAQGRTGSTSSGSRAGPTEFKTHCIDDVREQTERTALAPVPAPSAATIPV